MFEDFRQQTDDTSFPAPEPDQDQLREGLIISEPELHFLGMTAFQRFALLLVLFLMLLVSGILFLLVTQRVVPPFFS